jgi:hypothetical protein
MISWVHVTDHGRTVCHLQGIMRKMNREDKQRANDLVRVGGRKVQEVLNRQHYYSWVLLQSPEEFFAKNSPSDGTEPILLLVNIQT